MAPLGSVILAAGLTAGHHPQRAAGTRRVPPVSWLCIEDQEMGTSPRSSGGPNLGQAAIPGNSATEPDAKVQAARPHKGSGCPQYRVPVAGHAGGRDCRRTTRPFPACTAGLAGVPDRRGGRGPRTRVSGRSRLWRHVHDHRSARAEERHDQREHFAGPLYHPDVGGPGEHRELRVRQELEHLHHVGQRREVAVAEDQQGGRLQ